MPRDRPNPFLDGFILIEGILLFIVAVPLLLAAGARAAVLTLDAADPLLYLTHRQVLWVAAGLQLALSAFVLLKRSRRFQLFLTVWLTANLLVYQAGCFYYHTPSLGALCHLTNRLPVSPWVFDLFGFLTLAWMLLGSSAFLVQNWWSTSRQATRPNAANLRARDVAVAT